jgi:rhamnosyltransferase
MDNTSRPSVDVIVPTCDPDEKFHRLMRMLRCQTYPVNKIIIMNTGTALPEEEHFRKHLQQENAGGHVPLMEVNHLRPEDFDHGGTRNAGAACSDAEICLFITQDAVPENEYLIERLIAPICQTRIGQPVVAVSYARQLPDEDCRPVERFTRIFNYPAESRIKTRKDLGTLGIKTFFASNVCAAYRMDVFRSRGGFEEKTIFNEDMIYAGHLVKMGYAVAYAADARVIHSHNYSNAEQFHRNFDLAVSQKQHPEVFEGIRSESEGIRLVKRTAGYLTRQGKAYLIPGLVVTSGCKYLGYCLGKRYDRLPPSLVRRLSWNKRYWGSR